MIGFGVKRTDAIDVLIEVRALTLHVSARDLSSAILGTARDRLESLVAVDGALACRWEADRAVA